MVAVGHGARIPQALQPGAAGRDRRGGRRDPRRRSRAVRHRRRGERRRRAGAAALDPAGRGPRGRRAGGGVREPLVRPRHGLRRRRPEAVRRPRQTPRHPARTGRLRHRGRAPRLPGRAGPLRPLPGGRHQAARPEAVRRHRAGRGGPHRGRPRRRGLRLLGLRDHPRQARGPAAGRLLRPRRRRPQLAGRLAGGARGRARPGRGPRARRRTAAARRIPLRPLPAGAAGTVLVTSGAGRVEVTGSIDSPVGGPRAARPPRPCLDETRAQSDHRTITRGRGAVAARRRMGAVRQRLGACDTGQRAQGAVGQGQDRRPPAARGGRARRRGRTAPLGAPPPAAAAHPLPGRRCLAARQPPAQAADDRLHPQAARAGRHRPGRRGRPGPAGPRPRLVLDHRLSPAAGTRGVAPAPRPLLLRRP
ncbi:hypothetical protein SBRY_130069 [Actinacidiphila bryophytorum]|uniref:Uncharacterized protein n=1 Tax=Actinacidiphila bryophytorum TaxID=1436133 RepID=A0A9W4E8T2_9ACTN|nr:hypothetical protein SBRY_130069 [Actinacidiphila bryophytorum]